VLHKKALSTILVCFLLAQILFFVFPVYAVDSENFIDNDSSDVDTHADHGTSSNFTAQQDSNVAYNDTLTEANTAAAASNTTVLNNGFEVGAWNSLFDQTTGTWIRCLSGTPTGYTPHAGTNATYCGSTNDGSIYSDDVDMTTATKIYVTFWWMDDDLDGGTDFEFYVYDGSAYDLIVQLDATGQTYAEDTWYQYSWSSTDNQYFDTTFRLCFSATPEPNEAAFIDDVVIIREVTPANNYELDMEFQWTTIDYAQTNEYICIRTGSTFGAENIVVKYRNGGSWTTLVTMTTVNTWYNTSLALTSGTLTLQFLGGTETSDTVQSTWQIECSLVHVWTVSELNFFGNILLTFLTNTHRSILFSRQGVVPLSFNVASIYARLASILNFFGEILFQFTMNSQRAMAFTRESGTSLTFSFDKQRTVAWVLGSSVPLSFIATSTYARLANILNFFGNIPFNIATGLQNALSFTRQGVASLNFLTGTQRALTLNRENSIPLAFNMLSKYGQARSLAFLGNIVFQFAEAFQKAVSITYSSTIPLSFTISTLYSQAVQGFLYFFGYIPISFASNLERIISFNVQGAVPLTFIMNRAYSRLATLLNLFGTIIFNFAINMAKTFGFNIFSTETLAFTVNSITNIIGAPVSLFIFGLVNFIFNIGNVGYATIPLSGLAEMGLLEALFYVGFVFGLIALSVVLVMKTKRRREE